MMRVTSSDERRAETWAVSGPTSQDENRTSGRATRVSAMRADKSGGVQGSGPDGDTDGERDSNPGGGNSLARYLGRHICR